MDAEGSARAPASRGSPSRAAARIPQRFGTCGCSRGHRDERFPFVRQLQQEGFLDQNDEPLSLVCRKELFAFSSLRILSVPVGKSSNMTFSRKHSPSLSTP
jgi:hypothetical protein